jgi:hypothetical protein
MEWQHRNPRPTKHQGMLQDRLDQALKELADLRSANIKLQEMYDVSNNENFDLLKKLRDLKALVREYLETWEPGNFSASNYEFVVSLVEKLKQAVEDKI